MTKKEMQTKKPLCFPPGVVFQGGLQSGAVLSRVPAFVLAMGSLVWDFVFNTVGASGICLPKPDPRSSSRHRPSQVHELFYLHFSPLTTEFHAIDWISVPSFLAKPRTLSS